MNFREAVLKPAVAPVILAALPNESAQKVQPTEPPADKPKPKNQFSGIVISRCYGGFGISKAAINLYRKRYENKFKKPFTGHEDSISTVDPIFIGVVLELGKAASDEYANLVVVYFNSRYDGYVQVHEYDGNESAGIDVKGYKLGRIALILKTTSLSLEDKVKKTAAVLRDECKDARVYHSIPEGGFVARTRIC